MKFVYRHGYYPEEVYEVSKVERHWNGFWHEYHLHVEGEINPLHHFNSKPSVLIATNFDFDVDRQLPVACCPENY